MNIVFPRLAVAAVGCLFLAACDGSATAPEPEPAPNLTGIWVGTLTHASDPYTDEWRARLDLTEFDGTAEGYLVGEMRTSFQGAFLVMGVTGQVSGADVLLLDGTMRSDNPRPGFYWCEDRTFELEYRRVQGREQLVGEWSTPTPGCSGGRITLEKE